MTLRLETRRGKRRWVIDIHYTDSAGEAAHYRRDAKLQTKKGAETEHDIKKSNAVLHGNPHGASVAKAEALPERSHPLSMLVSHYEATTLATLKHTTQLSYKEVVRNVIMKRIGDVNANEITARDLTRMDAELAAGGVSNARRVKALLVMRRILVIGHRDGLLDELPEFPRPPKLRRNEVRVPAETEMDSIQKCASSAAAFAIDVSRHTGLRAGEIRGLKWPDIDLNQGLLVVRRAISRGVTDVPKSGRERTVPLNNYIRKVLAEKLASAPSKRGYVCLTKEGKIWGEFGLNQSFRRAVRKAGLTGFTFHDCRAFFVTSLFREGVGAVIVQRLCGHEALATTQRYSGYDARDGHDAVGRLKATARKHI